MNGETVQGGLVSVEEWNRVADDDLARRLAFREGDIRSSILTAISGMLMLAMLSVGPMWTVIAVVGGSDEHSAMFDRLWLLPLALTLGAAVPLSWAIQRERTRQRWILVGFLAASLAIQLATCPWL